MELDSVPYQLSNFVHVLWLPRPHTRWKKENMPLLAGGRGDAMLNISTKSGITTELRGDAVQDESDSTGTRLGMLDALGPSDLESVPLVGVRNGA